MGSVLRSRVLSHRFWVAVGAALVAAAFPAAILAQPAGPPPAQPIAQPADFATARAKYENLTAAQVQAMGYALPAPECVSAGPLGAMGFHVINFAQYGAQYGSGRADAQNPPVVLVDGAGRVRGIEWEINQNAPAPVLFGQTLTIQPGHPGTEDPHYMLHGYFRPNGQVLFSDFDPQITCPAAGALPAGYQVAAAQVPPVQAPRPAAAPVQVPAALPRTGEVASLAPLLALAGAGLAGAGWIVRRRGRGVV